MKCNHLHFFIILLSFFVFQSCSYLPSEIPLTEIPKPTDDGSDIIINLTPNVDTLKLYKSVSVTYTIDVQLCLIDSIEFFLDGSKIINVSKEAVNSYSATLPVPLLRDGLHELKIITYSTSNSGSIADKVNAAKYLNEYHWPILVNRNAREYIKFTAIESVLNGVKLSWYKYDYNNFRKHIVTRFSNIFGQNKELLNISNPYFNTIVDEEFIEGDYVLYSLVTYLDEDFATDTRLYVEEIEKPGISINSDRTFDVSWSKSKYLHNLKSYYLKTIIPQYGFKEEFDIPDKNQTSVRFNENIGFGANYGIQLRYIPKNYTGSNNFDVKGGLTSFGLGDSIPSFQRGFLIGGKSTILIYNDGKFSKYNYSTGQSIGSLTVSPIESIYQKFIIGSPNGKLFGYFEGQEFVIRNSEDFSLIKRLNINAFANNAFVCIKMSISNNGILATVDAQNTLRIFNLPDGVKSMEKKYGSPFSLRDAVLSPNGKNICLKLRNNIEETCSWILYTMEADQFTEIGSSSKNGTNLESTLYFSPVSGKIIHFNYQGMHDYQVDIVNEQSFEVEKSVKIPSFFVPIAYDYFSDRVIAQYKYFPTRKYSLMYDLKTGNHSFVVQFVGRECILFDNGIVYAGNGRSIKVEDHLIQ